MVITVGKTSEIDAIIPENYAKMTENDASTTENDAITSENDAIMKVTMLQRLKTIPKRQNMAKIKIMIENDEITAETVAIIDENDMKNY